MEIHRILGNKVRLYRRVKGGSWHCSTYLKSKEWRKSTKEKKLSKAKDIAEDWYLELRGKASRGELKNEMTFAKAAAKFKEEYEVITYGERNPEYVQGHYMRLRLYLLPYFGKMGLSEITPGIVQEYRAHRLNPPEGKKVPARNTLYKDIVTLRLVLKTAVRYRWLNAIPDLSTPYRSSNKVSHRAWFSPDEYKELYTASRERGKKQINSKHRLRAEQLHDKILFLANTGIRPDEANWLEYRDVSIVEDKDTNETILEIEVRGKRGVGYCKSTAGAVLPFKRMIKRNNPDPTDKLFSENNRKQFNRLLEKLNLKFDRQGNRRTFYSLRHSYISFRLMEGADIYQIAKNCRTSVEMIEKHYAVHLKNQIDASAINVRKGRR